MTQPLTGSTCMHFEWHFETAGLSSSFLDIFLSRLDCDPAQLAKRKAQALRLAR